jgi:hypothetical protein
MEYENTLKYLNDELRCRLGAERLTLGVINSMDMKIMKEVLLDHFKRKVIGDGEIADDVVVKRRALDMIKDYSYKSYPFDKKIRDESMYKYVYDRLLDKWDKIFDSMKDDRLWEFSLKKTDNIDIENLKERYKM